MMKINLFYKKIFLVSFCISCLFIINSQAQMYTVPYSGSNSYTTCSGILYDHGGTGNYSNYANGYTTLYPVNPGDKIEVSGTISGESCCDYLNIYDGVGTSGTRLWCGVTSTGTVPLVRSTSGPLTIQFTSDYSRVGEGFALNISCCDACSCGDGPTNLRTVAQGSNFVEIAWDYNPDVPQYIIEYGLSGFPRGTGTQIVTTETSYTITGLTEGVAYDIYVYYDCNQDGSITGEIYRQIAACAQDLIYCINYTNLYGTGVTCTYGTYYSPFSYTSVNSYRHVVMSPSNGNDPYSNGLMPCVSPCESNSVRLGRDSYGNEGESITYSYTVDTTQSDYLILKYAVVLYHRSGYASTSQPKFAFTILDNNGVELNPTCNSLVYIAGYNTTGWNYYNYNSNVLWKNWSTHSVDLTPYHGQTIKIRLITQHGSSSSYFAYAYFTLGCGHKYELNNKSCGNVAQLEFSAPMGFSYRWYLGSNPSQTISTNQTVAVTPNASDSIYCVVSSLSNPTCTFTLSNSISPRYPLANFSYAQIGCEFKYQLTNLSTISSDGTTPNGSDEPCETYYWDFGNGQTSTEENPLVTYDSAGVYTIQLVAGIMNDECQDTITQILNVAEFEPEIVGDTLSCSGQNHTLVVTDGNYFSWSTGDSTATIVVNPATTTQYVVTATNAGGCSKTLQHTLTILPSYNNTINLSLCIGDSYTENGFNLQNLNQVGNFSYTLPLTTIDGCDSIIQLNLIVNPLPQLDLGDDFSICFEKMGSFYLDAGGEYDDYLWSTGERTRYIQPRDTGLFSLTVTLDGCETTDYIFISDNCPLHFYLPNSISPYYPDGINDYFMLSNTAGIRSLEINIFDRWGKLVFESKDINFKWDGKVNGKIHPNQIFAYRLYVMGMDTKRYVFKGTITVL